MYAINRKFKKGDGGIYNPKYLDEAIRDKDLLHSLMIAQNNIEILLRYIYLYGKIVDTNRTITQQDMIKADNPMFARLNYLCKDLMGEEEYDEIKVFNAFRTKIHTIVVINQFKQEEEIYFSEIEKTKDICNRLFSTFFKILQNKDH